MTKVRLSDVSTTGYKNKAAVYAWPTYTVVPTLKKSIYTGGPHFTMFTT